MSRGAGRHRRRLVVFVCVGVVGWIGLGSADGQPSAQRLEATTLAVPRTSANAVCTPGYDPCIPMGMGDDVDCAGGFGSDGPRYVDGPVRVFGFDIYDLDLDHDGFGCELRPDVSVADVKG